MIADLNFKVTLPGISVKISSMMAESYLLCRFYSRVKVAQLYSCHIAQSDQAGVFFNYVQDRQIRFFAGDDFHNPSGKSCPHENDSLTS